MSSSNGAEAIENNNTADSGVLFPKISADDECGVTEISSLCLNCEEEGLTKLLFIQIPFFREIILSSFSCPHCGYSNNEIQSAGAIQEKGVTWTLNVTSVEDLNRQVVRADSASVLIPSLEFEIPAESQKGTLTTVEGILQRAVSGLSQQQPVRKVLQPEIAEKIDICIENLKNLLMVKTPFVMKLEDPAGNSFIQNPIAPKADPNLTKSFFVRSLEQDKQLGLQISSHHFQLCVEPSWKKASNGDAYGSAEKEMGLVEAGPLDLTNEVLTFNTNCPSCNSPCPTNMKALNIPYFKEVIVMATNCDSCGERTNEVKSGAGFSPKGRKITLKVEEPEDLSRDVLKSETCALRIPELDLESGGIAISGKFTTVEGLILDIKNIMVDANPFVSGDSSKSAKMAKLADDLLDLATGKKPFTLILDDPNANSYVQDLYIPEVDPRLSHEEYERTYEQNEELGLNDMKTEDYVNR